MLPDVLGVDVFCRLPRAAPLVGRRVPLTFNLRQHPDLSLAPSDGRSARLHGDIGDPSHAKYGRKLARTDVARLASFLLLP